MIEYMRFRLCLSLLAGALLNACTSHDPAPQPEPQAAQAVQFEPLPELRNAGQDFERVASERPEWVDAPVFLMRESEENREAEPGVSEN